MDSLPSVENDIFSNDSMTSIFTNIPKFYRFFDFALQAPLRMTQLQAFSPTFLSSLVSRLSSYY